MTEENMELPTTGGKFKNGVKKFFGAIWFWIKDNWLTLLVIGVVVILSASALKGCGKDEAYQSLFDQYGKSIEDHNQQLQEIRSVQEQEQLEQDRRLQEFINEMNNIKRQYQEELDRISQIRTTTRNRIVTDAREDPGTLTRRIRDTFGIPIF